MRDGSKPCVFNQKVGQNNLVTSIYITKYLQFANCKYLVWLSAGFKSFLESNPIIFSLVKL